MSNKLDTDRERYKEGGKGQEDTHFGHTSFIAKRLAKEGPRGGAVRETGSPEWLRVLEPQEERNFKFIPCYREFRKVRGCYAAWDLVTR